jgi:uncharacterized protein
MKPAVLVDAGPLVALGNREDYRHADALATLKALTASLVTCWPVLTEVAYLLRSRPEQVEQLLSTVVSGALRIAPLTAADVPAISAVMARYRSLDLQLADAALMVLAEREAITSVFTYDLRDFGVFRLRSGASLTIVG